MERTGPYWIFRKVFSQKNSAEGMADIDRGFRFESGREFFKEEFPLGIFGVLFTGKCWKENVEPTREVAVECRFPSGSPIVEPHAPILDGREIFGIGIEGFASADDDDGSERGDFHK